MDALLLVDLQNDFAPASGESPAGALAVPDGNAVVPVANRLIERFKLVIATQDWHPADHLSFASQHPGKKVGDVITFQGLKQILWPDHCVQDTHGSQFLPDLHRDKLNHVVRKGTDRHIDSYSGFYDNGHRKATDLDYYLRKRHIDRLYVMGLATDVCVKYTVLDARRLGLRTTVIRDGCRGVDLKAGDSDRALRLMRDAGADVVESRTLV